MTDECTSRIHYITQSESDIRACGVKWKDELQYKTMTMPQFCQLTDKQVHEASIRMYRIGSTILTVI